MQPATQSWNPSPPPLDAAPVDARTKRPTSSIATMGRSWSESPKNTTATPQPHEGPEVATLSENPAEARQSSSGTHPISEYGAEYDLPASLTPNQWSLLEKTVLVLSPFEELTKEMSCAALFLSEVIPSVTVLKWLLSREYHDDSGIKNMKSTLLEAINRRFQAFQQEPLYAVATLLDPRFKYRYFSCTDHIRDAKEALTKEMEKTEPSETETTTESPRKRPRMEAEPETRNSNQSGLKGIFEEIVQEHEEHGTPLTSARAQLQTYLMEPTVPRSDSPFQYWANNLVRFPTLVVTAAKFISAPSTSVDSERLFSAASNIINEKRNRLGGESRNAHFP